MRERKQGFKCLTCKVEYSSFSDAATCIECHEEAYEAGEELKKEIKKANKTNEVLKRLKTEIDELNSKLAFLRFFDHDNNNNNNNSCRSSSMVLLDVILIPSDESEGDPVATIPAHKAVLASRSPVFKAMFETEMEETRSGTINISDASYDALQAFVNYLYNAEACLDEHLAYDLLALAEKYQVKHLKTYCEKYLISKLTEDNAVATFGFAHQHNAIPLLEAALSLIIENMDELTNTEEYRLLKEKDPRLVLEIYEAFYSKQGMLLQGIQTSTSS